MLPASFPAYIVRREDPRNAAGTVEQATFAQLPPGDVIVETACSSLNYKDALAAKGHPGIARQLPHVPGIDCAGTVVESQSNQWKPGDRVLVTGYELGAERWGGFSQYVRVPADWPVALPDDVSFDEAMSYGTAGFTAAQCVAALQHHGIVPEKGPVVVTGATGGVGSIAVALLARLGYETFAVTGKSDEQSRLRAMGAADVLSRDDVSDATERPLLSSRWAGAVDVVGGPILATLVRQLKHRGCVAACGLTAGAELPLTVHPFILRGATLAGIDSAKCPREPRVEMWRRLFSEWRLPTDLWPPSEVSLTELSATVNAMLAGEARGRTLVRPTA